MEVLGTTDKDATSSKAITATTATTAISSAVSPAPDALVFTNVTYCHPITKGCFIYAPDNTDTVNEYHHYLIGLIKELMNDYKANFVLGYHHHIPEKSEITRTIRINYSVEHTLVRPGGRTVNRKDHKGRVPVTYLNKGTEFYLVREVQFDKHLEGDIVLEYR